MEIRSPDDFQNYGITGVNAPDRPALIDPSKELGSAFDEELDTAALAHSRRQKVYGSVQELSQLIGGEYGNRVLYELLQNAHDAHTSGADQVAIHLEVTADYAGKLYVANGGSGFEWANVDAIRNIATSTKRVGEGIGNKGVGFRSVEALTDDPRVYSCLGSAGYRLKFDGYCFRFARPEEIERRLIAAGHSASAKAIAATLPRYLAAIPVEDQPSDISRFAEKGYATVVELTLSSAQSVELAVRQLRELIESDAPVLLFLDRISTLDISTSGVELLPSETKLSRTKQDAGIVANEGVSHELVTLSPGQAKWLLSRKILPKDQVVEAVANSTKLEPGLRKWIDWRGEAVVSIAVPMDGASNRSRGRLYNFLPMSAQSECPFFGHLDAPFFTAINRERARLELPLNSFFLDSGASLAVETAASLAGGDLKQYRLAVVDMLAWRVTDGMRLQTAFRKAGTYLSSAVVWPTNGGGWARFGEVFGWPSKDARVFTASRTTKAGADNILDTRLEGNRRAAVDALSKSVDRSLDPDPTTVATWAELVAAALHEKKSSPEQWADYYSDLLGIFRPTNLQTLRGRAILVDRDGSLIGASPSVYVRSDNDGRRRTDAPLPPGQLARKLTILSETCRMRAEAVVSFQKAGLCSIFVATEILQRLQELFGDRPADSRRVAALQWAFDVWKFDTSAAHSALKKANLHVPARAGWVPASAASFSQSWSPVGVDVEYFLAEARQTCKDADYAWDHLLTEVTAWPVEMNAKQDWLRFLSDAGVTDGLVPMPAKISDGPHQGAEWHGKFYWSSDPALGSGWVSAAAYRTPNHPYTRYWRRGAVWKMPGQTVAQTLSEEARTRFAYLLVRHLQTAAKTYLSFQLLREDRDYRQYDLHVYKTPIATFLEHEPWFPQEDRDALFFVQASKAWVLTDRRTHPRFVPRAPDELVSLLTKDSQTSSILTDSPFSVQFWRDKATAKGRLEALANACQGLAQAEKATLRKQYDQAWLDLIESGELLPPAAPLICETSAGFSRLASSNPPTQVFLRTDKSQDTVKLLIESGARVLATGTEVPASSIIEASRSSTGVEMLLAHDADVELLVDGLPFVAALANPLITDLIPWLPEAFVLGHELAARDLERTASITHVLERLRSIRVRVCASIELSVGADAAPKTFARYMHRDEVAPTLITTRELDAFELGECAGLISGTIHRGLRTFEVLLLKLAYLLPRDHDLRNVRPSEENYAQALQVDVDLVHDELASFRDDDAGLLDVLFVLLCCELGRERSEVLRDELQRAHSSRWGKVLGDDIDPARLDQIMAALDETLDLSVLHRQLGIPYAQINSMLFDLGRGSLTSEAELRRLFDLYVDELRPELLDRLRSHFLGAWEAREDLSEYCSLRTLDFLKFNGEWVRVSEGLSLGEVAQFAREVLEQILTVLPERALDSLQKVLGHNRKVVVEVLERARPLLHAILGDAMPTVWEQSSLELTGVLESSGVLDFRPLDEEVALNILGAAGFWPSHVPKSLNLDAHGLTTADLDRERRKALDVEAEKRRLRNLVEFGDLEFDASESDFSTRFASIAHAAFGTCDWRSRSSVRTISLAVQPEGEPTRGGGGGRGSKGRVTRPPDSIRLAIGLAGELLALRYLEAKHGDRFTEESWVSENRTALYPLSGNDTLGFDFRVNTKSCEWLYEVKATPGDSCEFELTDNEYRQAISAAADRAHRFRILFIQYAFNPLRCRVLELPNPTSDSGKSGFRIVGRSSVRMRFEPL